MALMIGVIADAGPRENALDEHGPGQQAPERQAGHGGDGQERRPHDVAPDDRPLRQPLGSGRPHVVVVDDLEHRSPGEAEHDPHREHAEDHPGQHQVIEGVAEQRPLAGEQRVDGV